MGEKSSVVPGKCLEVAVFSISVKGSFITFLWRLSAVLEFSVPPRGVKPWLEYLCKLAGCTLNVQPANLHNFFQRKARHVTLNAFQSLKIS